MADLPELWTERTPQRRSLPARAPAFGLAREAERMGLEVPLAAAPVDLPEPGPDRGPFMTYLWLPWSYGDRETGYLWHRIRCRLGLHERNGGHTMHLEGTVVFIEARCRWCDAPAPG